MSDIYIPGVKSRFETEKLIEDLMKVERIPKERAEKNIIGLRDQKTVWQDVGRRMSALRESARALYSFQNPFTERIARSTDESVLSGSATREASEQERSFTVKRAATADRFLSLPLAANQRVGAGDYSFSVGKEEIAFSFRGGTLREFVDALNRRGRDKIRADIITVEPGTRSLVVESLVTGVENRLGFAKEAESLALEIGMIERVNDSSRRVDAASGRAADEPSRPKVSVADGVLGVAAEARARIPFEPSLGNGKSLTLELEIAVALRPSDNALVQGPPSGPVLPDPGGISYGGITIPNDPSSIPLPRWTPPPAPKRVDDPQLLNLVFSDGSTAPLPPMSDGSDFVPRQFSLEEHSGGKDIVALELANRNTHRDISVRNIRVFDPDAFSGFKPKNPIATASDALITMDGIEVRRPSNAVSDLIPGVTVNIHGSSEKPVRLAVEPNREAAKDAVIALVGNYNRIMADINVLTRNDDKLIQELSYLSNDEQEEMREKLGSMQGDSTLNQFRSALQRAVSAVYPTSAERDMAILSQLGVSTDSRRGSGGYDASRLRGYLEIDEKVLDAALRTNLPAARELFGSDTDGDLIIDSGFAYSVDNLIRPYVETGGIVTLKTRGIDTRISQEERRVEALDKQIAAKEASLKRQYGLMEGALNRMERTSSSIDQFSDRSNNR